MAASSSVILICFRVARIKLIKKMLYGIIYIERGQYPRKEGVSLIKADKPRKTYVLDTSVLLNSPYAINAFDEHEVVIPMCVLQELRAKANGGSGEARANAAEVFRILDVLTHSNGGSLKSGVHLNNGGIVRIGESQPGVSIFDEARSCSGTIVSREPAVRVVANCMEIPAEDYKAEIVVRNGGYAGRCRIYVTHDEMKEFADTGILRRPAGWYATTMDGALLSEEYALTANEFVVLVDSAHPDGATTLGRWSEEKEGIIPLQYYSRGWPVYGVQTRNVGQVFAFEALLAPVEVAPLVILKGPAGTAKTFLSMAAALEQAYNNDIYRRVLATRSNAEMDKTLGYLKGDEVQKLSPLLRPIFDNIENLHKTEKRKGKKDGVPYEDPAKELVQSGVVSIQSMGYMRGRSITDTYIIIDEAQNMSLTQVLSMITRAGEGSKIVLLGDPDQIDNPFLDRQNNGLVFASEKMKGSPLCWQISFTEDECTRSPLAKEAIRRLTPKGTPITTKDI